jgi:uncharacterized protein
MIDESIAREHKPHDIARKAAFDLVLVLGTLFLVKSALLRFDAFWTYAGPISLLASVVVATVCLRRNRERWADLGFNRPASIFRMLSWSAVALVVTMVAGFVIEIAISSAGIERSDGADPRYAGRFAALPGNTGLFVYWVSVSWVVGAFAEEMLFRAMLFTRLERLFSGTAYPVLIAVALQAIVFGQQHFYYQGWSGALATGGIALISGALYLLLKRNLWPLVISHGLANTIGITLIYTGVQSAG